MQQAYLGLGSNLGDREANLRDALALINALPQTDLAEASPIYETAPMGPQDQGAYLNMAAKVTTMLAAGTLLEHLLQIETQLGRPDREFRRHWGPRAIDLDLLLFGDAVIDQPGLTVPHPGMHERWFVLQPLVDIAPDVLHPVLGRSVCELLVAVDAPSSQEVLP